jgi:hypothetical protein
LPETARARPDPKKLRAAATAVAGHTDLTVLAPVDMVLHSVTHLFHNEQLHHGLRDLVDIDGLLRHFGKQPDFWLLLVPRAKELGLMRPLFYGLRYAKTLLHTPIPTDILEESRAGRPLTPMLCIMDALFERALMPVHVSYSDWLTGLARQLLYVRATWLRMPPLLLARHLFHKAFISPKPE